MLPADSRRSCGTWGEPRQWGRSCSCLGLRNPSPWRWQSPRWLQSWEHGDSVGVSRSKCEQMQEGRSSDNMDLQQGREMRLTSDSSPVLSISRKVPLRPHSLFLLDLDAVSVQADERVHLQAEI